MYWHASPTPDFTLDITAHYISDLDTNQNQGGLTNEWIWHTVCHSYCYYTCTHPVLFDPQGWATMDMGTYSRLNNDDTSEEVNVDQARLQFMVELVEYVDKLKVDALDSTCVNPMYTGRTPAAQPEEQRHVLMETWNMERKNTIQPATTRSP